MRRRIEHLDIAKFDGDAVLGVPLLSSKKALPPLDVVPFLYSRQLFWLRTCLLCLLGLFSGLALFPLIMTNVLWVVVWVVLAIGLFWVSKFYMAFSLGGAFAYENQSWWLKVGDKVYSPLRLNGDVLILSWVVILRFEAAGHQDKHKSNFFKRITPEGIALIICRDSVSGTDFSRLKTWLRACLRRSA